ncbi:selenium metabolism-associated LysR family transcriptional regulator [Fusibacter sp. JL298sf-3]
MDFRQLEAFVNVAKYKSFSKAGKALYLSQPTVSLHISNLEKELSVSLFDRTSKEVNLTPAGSEFLNYALDMINMKNKAIHHVVKANNAISGSIHISTTLTPNLTVLPKAIQTFQDAHPDVRFIVEEKPSTVILEDVCSLNSDVGIVSMGVESERFNTYPLFEDPLVFVCSKEAALEGTVSFQEICGYKFIHRTEQSSTRRELERTMTEIGYDTSLLNTIIESDNMNFIMRLVRQNRGISYMSKSIYDCYKNFLDVESFAIKGLEIKRHVHVITNKRRTLSPATEDFVKLLIKQAAEEPHTQPAYV